MSSPRVTIGVPVYNGQKYIRFTMDSLLAQTFTDFEIIVTDNCSTDSTPQIVQEYAARDPRVRYIRNETNIGPARNYNVSLDMARGEFFKWNPADDVCAPEFLAKCLAALEAHPEAVLAYPRTNVIDTDGKLITQYTYERNFDDPRAHVRLARIMHVNHRSHGAHELYGLFRTEAIRKTGGMRTHVRGDSVLLARLVLLAPFHRVEEHLFFNRDHTDRSSKYLAKKMVRKGSRLSKYLGCGPLPSAEWWDPRLRGRIVFPEWRVLREYIRAVQETSMPLSRRVSCYGSLCIFGLRHLPKLGRDVIIAIEQFLNLMLGITDEPKGKERGLAT